LREEVEDLKQEVFLRVYCHLNTFRVDEGNLDSWVIRVGRNLIFDRLRQIRRLPSRGKTEALERLDIKDDRTPSPEKRSIGDEISKAVRSGLRLLSPQLEQVLTLRYLQEMDYDEIAGVLGIPNGTVKSRIKRGRDKLASQAKIQRLAQSAGSRPGGSAASATVP
jgi:RNA polymerase sigma-70 factor (ECF subfamily)